MYTIRVRRKHKLFIAFIVFTMFGSISLLKWVTTSSWGIDFFNEFPRGPCNTLINWAPKTQPIIAIVGAPGSGVYWARYLVEQMTGLYTGSSEEAYPEVFRADGQAKQVVAVMAHHIREVHRVQGAIVVYRNLKDVVRTQYTVEQGPGAFLEAPMASYYGKKWSRFAARKVREWTATYRSVLDSGLPLLIIGYEELEDPNQLRTQLLRISNYLHVPIRSSILDCVIDRAHEFWLRPKPLRRGFQPFNLLRVDDNRQYDRTEWDIQMLVRLRRDRYRPKVR